MFTFSLGDLMDEEKPAEVEKSAEVKEEGKARAGEKEGGKGASGRKATRRRS